MPDNHICRSGLVYSDRLYYTEGDSRTDKNPYNAIVDTRRRSMDLHSGQRITAPFLPALAEVKAGSSRPTGADRGAGTRRQGAGAQFRMEEDIQATGYIVHEDVWRERVE